MTTLATIGAGHIGSAVARLAIAAGYEVVLSNSRGPETLQALIAELGPNARAATPREAAADGDLVLVSVPLAAYAAVPVDELCGKTVIDTNNYYPDRDGHYPDLDDESTTTAELLQSHLPDSAVVKAFSNIYYPHLTNLARPVGAPDRSALAIAGDSSDAKEAVTRFLDAIGYDALDVGPLSEGWRFQRDTAAYTRPYFSGEEPGPGNPVDREELAARLAEAKRYRDMD